MKNIIEQMCKLQDSLEDIIEKRRTTFNEQGKKYRDSEKGTCYEGKTDCLQEMVDSLVNWQVELSDQ